MPLPNALLNTTDDTTIIGDMEAFMVYIESGQACHDWWQLHAVAMKELDSFIQSRSRSWNHIVCQGSEPSLALQPPPDKRPASNAP
jgi:hypothetical protein